MELNRTRLILLIDALTNAYANPTQPAPEEDNFKHLSMIQLEVVMNELLYAVALSRQFRKELDKLGWSLSYYEKVITSNSPLPTFLGDLEDLRKNGELAFQKAMSALPI